jgi:hypothetical protein
MGIGERVVNDGNQRQDSEKRMGERDGREESER